MIKFKNETNNKQQTTSNKSIFSFAKSYIRQKYKTIFLLTTLTLIISGSLVLSKFYQEQVLVKAQNTPTLTVSVEKYTQNHLPNITGNCTIGDNLLFTIKKGNTGIVSETIARTCTESPYSLTPTIALPDGKYRVSVSVVANPTCNLIEGSPDGENLIGTIGDDCIYGFGGDDILIGGSGNDKLYADNFTNYIGGTAQFRGGGGNDEIYGGTQFNFINGTNNTIKGIGEVDKLIGGGTGSNNFFQLAGDCPNGDFYIGNGDSDYAEIKNFDISNDIIELSNTTISISSYNITFANGVSSLYYNGDLMAKIDSIIALDISASYFSGQCGNQ